VRAGPRVAHYAAYRWRAHSVFALLGVRPHHAKHTPAERDFLVRLAAGARTIVELGVDEGGSARALREALAPDGHLHLVDPWQPRRRASQLAARRLVRRVARGTVVWHRAASHVVAADWDEPVDFVFIDGNHSYEGVSRDWADWTSLLRPGGIVALHNARRTGENPTCPHVIRKAEEICASGGWIEVGAVDSTVAWRRGVLD
jgi:predicted O-methyltransferase YrrM